MLERISLFVLGGGGYLAVELAWRGTSHWTMFLAGGICLCALQWLAVHPVPLPVAAGTGALGASALEVGWVVAVLRITGKATISPVYCTRKAAAES